jgi:transcription elongation GreA/GreB family factor
VEKRKVVQEIQSYLAEELASLLPAAEKAADGGTALSQDSAQRIRDIQQQLTMYKFLPIRDYGVGDVICPASLVELELSGRHAFYFLVPNGGGLIMKIDGHPIQVITPNSPLGEAMLGKKVGDVLEVSVKGSARSYKIVSMR